MSWFKNLKVKVKMIVSFSLVIVLMAVLAVVAIIEMQNLSYQYEATIDHSIESELQMRAFVSSVRDVRRIAANMILYAPDNDPAKIESLNKDALESYAIGQQALDAFNIATKTDHNFSESEKNNIIRQSDELQTVYTKYKNEILDPVYKAALTGDSERALGYMVAAADVADSMRELNNVLLEEAVNISSTSLAGTKAIASKTVVILIAVAITTAIIAVVVALYIAGIISKPLVVLSTFMNKAGSTGDISLSQGEIETINKDSQFKDEIGQAINGSASFVGHVTKIANELEAIAGGDLSHDVKLLSDLDTMGKSMKHMVDNLNTMFAEIHSSTTQVSMGSKQIADGAQSLAQGSTEQAASIEELSSSIAEIAEQTKTNALTADKTAKLSTTIKENAEKGNRQMNDMITAVSEINDASKSISKIIKTIDDIAFQTNILALNAAVEAARAGQHGKGFAVVAEEVRNLASKSAEAAKDTGDMIQNSMDKAELGARIAGETAESLREIVIGINESSILISEIADASAQQTLGISQINTGIDQVAQVVQQNSATAEESAAASEEMSGQSDMLQQLISQFRLNESGGMYRSLPTEKISTQKRLALPEKEYAFAGSARSFAKY